METDLQGIAWPVAIGQAAQLSGVSAKMLRHYEGLGLLGQVPRTEGNYRQYGQADVHTLRFIRRARDMGFTLDEIRTLVSLWHNRRRSSETVKRIAEQHITELDQRIAALQAMRRTLQDLVQRCPGNQRPDCPILDDLGGGTCDKHLYNPHTEAPQLVHRAGAQ